MIQILAGLSNGQVLRRSASGLATAVLTLSVPESGTIRCSLFSRGRVLKSRTSRKISKAGQTAFELADIPSGGPYRLVITCGRAKGAVACFYVGDVWVLAGQSNMEGCGDMNGAARPHPLIQAFTMAREWRQASDPLHIPMESPDSCHSKGKPYTGEQAETHRRNTTKGVGVGIFFARKMLALSCVPQGLICTAHGGTNLTQWDPTHKTTDFLYGSLLTSVRATGQPVAGVLWYQGESDSNPDAHGKYTARMKQLVAAMRSDLGQPRLPWVICQSARVFSRNIDFACWNSIQDQQRLLPGLIECLDTVAAIDLPMDDPVHVSSQGFPLLAERFADAAARLAYGDIDRLPTPRPGEILLFSSGYSHRIEVRYDCVSGGLRSEGPAQGYAILDIDDQILPLIYKTSLRGNIAHLHLAEYPPAGARLVYGLGKTPSCNITDSRGHALPVFAPQQILSAEGWLPFVTSWRVSGILPPKKYNLRTVSASKLAAVPAEARDYGPSGFVDEHLAWERKAGVAVFTCTMIVPAPMRLEASMGYDGPFRMFIGEKPFFTDLEGTNPCIPDKNRKPVQLKAGRHLVRVAMDLNDGLAWGFYLRFRHLGASSSHTQPTDPSFAL